MSCSADVLVSDRANSLSSFAVNLIDTFACQMSNQRNLIIDRIEAFEDAAPALEGAITPADGEAAKIECLEHLDRITTLLAEFKAILDQINMETVLTMIKAASPAIATYRDEHIKAQIEERLAVLRQWHSDIQADFPVQDMREWIDDQAEWLQDLEDGEIVEREEYYEEEEEEGEEKGEEEEEEEEEEEKYVTIELGDQEDTSENRLAV